MIYCFMIDTKYQCIVTLKLLTWKLDKAVNFHDKIPKYHSSTYSLSFIIRRLNQSKK